MQSTRRMQRFERGKKQFIWNSLLTRKILLICFAEVRKCEFDCSAQLFQTRNLSVSFTFYSRSSNHKFFFFYKHSLLKDDVSNGSLKLCPVTTVDAREINCEFSMWWFFVLYSATSARDRVPIVQTTMSQTKRNPRNLYRWRKMW